jgi:hypothetical protein
MKLTEDTWTAICTVIRHKGGRNCVQALKRKTGSNLVMGIEKTQAMDS